MTDNFWHGIRKAVEASFSKHGIEKEKEGYIVNYNLLAEIIADEVKREVKKELLASVYSK